MIVLPTTTDTLELVTSGTSAVDVVVSYLDRNLSGGGMQMTGKQVSAITTATDTTVLSAPTQNVCRQLQSISIRNKGAATNVCTLQLDANGTEYEIHSVSLAAGEEAIYLDGAGWQKVTTDSLDVWKYVTADYVNATTSYTDITGLSQALLSGNIYAVEAILFTANDASTTGSQFSYNIDDAPTFSLFGEVGAVTNSVTAGAVGIGTATARDTAIVAQTTGQTAVGMHHIAGVLQPSANGTFVLRGKSEVAVAAGLTVSKGSWLHIRQVA